MPIYEYECRSCLEKFADLVPMRECLNDGVCPKCGKAGMRILSAPNWRAFRGSLTYDRMHNYPGGYVSGGTSSGDTKDIASEDW